MESQASYKFIYGYLPYTFGTIIIIYWLVTLSNSWTVNLGGAALLLIISGYLLVFQLAIFHLPAENKENFHLYCIAVTFANLFITPMIIGGFFGALIGGFS